VVSRKEPGPIGHTFFTPWGPSKLKMQQTVGRVPGDKGRTPKKHARANGEGLVDVEGAPAGDAKTGILRSKMEFWTSDKGDKRTNRRVLTSRTKKGRNG